MIFLSVFRFKRKEKIKWGKGAEMFNAIKANEMKKQISEIERVQRVAIQIILSNSKTGKSEFSYNMGLVILDLEPLDIRRENLCRTFARKTLRSKHSDIFNTRKNQHNTRLKKDYSENKCNTKRFYNSPVNYLTRLLNDK